MRFPHFIHVPKQSDETTKTVFIDNLPYDLFLLTDLTRCAAILKFCEDLDNITETTSTDSIFNAYIKLAKKVEGGIMNYFVANFEKILLMYIHARFGNLFNVIIERVKEPLVKFPIGCFVEKTNLVVIYSPPALIDYIDRLSMSLLMYSSNNGFIRSTDSERAFQSRGVQLFDDKIKALINVDNLQCTHTTNSYHSKAPRQVEQFLNGIAPNYEESVGQLTCDSIAHPSVAKMAISTIPIPHFDPISFSSTRICYDNEADRDKDGADDNDELFLTSNYIAAQNMMLNFNGVFSERNKSLLLFLSSIRTILSTAVRPIIDLFIIRADDKEQKNANKRKRHFSHLDCTAKNKLQQRLVSIDVNGASGDVCGGSGGVAETLNVNLRQKRLNIDVYIKN